MWAATPCAASCWPPARVWAAAWRVTATGAPISVPVGEGVLGRMFNVLGDAIDDVRPRRRLPRSGPSTGSPPAFENQRPVVEILETGIKVIDLLAPYAKGGKIGLFGGAGVGKTVLIQELIQQHRHRARRLLHLHRRGRAYPRGQRPVAGNDASPASLRRPPWSSVR